MEHSNECIPIWIFSLPLSLRLRGSQGSRSRFSWNSLLTQVQIPISGGDFGTKSYKLGGFPLMQLKLPRAVNYSQSTTLFIGSSAERANEFHFSGPASVAKGENNNINRPSAS